MNIWTFLDRNITVIFLLGLGVVFALTEKGNDGCHFRCGAGPSLDISSTHADAGAP